MYGWASGAGAGLDVIYQMLGNLADGRHIGAVIVAAAVGFLQQQSGVIQAVKVPEHGAGIQVQLLGQLLAAHGPLHHQPQHLHADCSRFSVQTQHLQSVESGLGGKCTQN